MKLTAFKVFQLMFCALNEVWERNQNDGLGLYLSEANPFLCLGESADPSVFIEFSRMFGEEKEMKDLGYDFIANYLDSLQGYYGDLKALFCALPITDYLRISSANLELEEEQLAQKYR